MVKKFTFFLLLGIFGLFTTNLFAQEDASIDPSAIKYWIGEGQNEVVFIVNWNEPDTALAWGYRFDAETVTVKDMMLDIQSADYRFGFVGESFVSDVTFNDGVLNLKLAGMWWMYNVNGQTAGEYFDAQTVSNGDWVKFGDESCGTITDPVNYYYVWTKEVAPVYAIAEEAQIAASEIICWIGEGDNNLVFCVNWNEPNIALAWGYRFATEEVTVKEVMESIAAADPRFSYVQGAWGIDDIIFDDGENHYALTAGAYWMYNINGGQAQLGYDVQTVSTSDFIKWGDTNCGTEIAPWTYVWEQPVLPVTVWTAVEEIESATVAVYPNPATNRLYINAEDIQRVELYDMTGRNVLTAISSVVDLSGVDAGVYFVTVRSSNAVNTTKLVVR